jgi:hypothetical protein
MREKKFLSFVCFLNIKKSLLLTLLCHLVVFFGCERKMEIENPQSARSTSQEKVFSLEAASIEAPAQTQTTAEQNSQGMGPIERKVEVSLPPPQDSKVVLRTAEALPAVKPQELPSPVVEKKSKTTQSPPQKMAEMVTSTTSSFVALRSLGTLDKVTGDHLMKLPPESLSNSKRRKHDVLGEKDRLLGMISEKNNGSGNSKIQVSLKQRQEMQAACQKSSLLQSMPPEYCSCDLGEFGEQVCQLSVQN